VFRLDLHSVELVDGVGNNKNLGVTDECLLLFGNGDGGGGPTPRMLSKVSLAGSGHAVCADNPVATLARTYLGTRFEQSRSPQRQDRQT